MNEMEFSPQLSPLYLAPDNVHIWWVALDQPRRTLPGLIALLSADEKARARRFHFERHRLRYITGRACLRQLLGGYLGLHPSQIEFEYSPLGKPALKTSVADRVLQFNLSNSEDRALIAFRWDHPLGIDLEFIHPMPDEDDFARQFFCGPEITLIHSLSGDAKRRTFFELWTCKEALLKAMGTGLTTPINEVEVALENGHARVVSIAGDIALSAGWQLNLFRPASGYQAALAFAGPGVKSSFYSFQDKFISEKDSNH